MLEAICSQWWALVILGFIAGTMSALLGIGGGIFMVPAFVLLLALPQKAAQGIALTVMVPTAIVGAARYWMGSHMEIAGYTRADVLMLAVFVGIGAVLGPLLGAYMAGRFSNQTLRVVFGAFLVLVGIYMLVTKPGEVKPRANAPAATSITAPRDAGPQ